MKTAIIFNEVPETISYFVVDGDHGELDGVYINETEDETLTDKLYTPLFGEDGYFKYKKLTLEQFRQEIIDGAYLIEVGFIV